MDYVYSPASSITEQTAKEPEITLPPSRQVLGYTKASSTLAELDAYEEEISNEEPLKYEPLPQEIKVEVSLENAKFPEEKSERLRMLSSKANESLPVVKRGGFLVNLATTYVEILDELLFVNNFEDFKNIFTKENRMVAVGIFLVILAVILMNI
jgi:hypothetical protein